MFGFIKNWFKKEEPKEEYYIDYRKLRQRELEQEFNIINQNINLHYVIKRIPYSWIDHIDKCVQYDEIKMAIVHLLYWSTICEYNFVTYGIYCNITPLWYKIKSSKTYKEYIVEQKLERMKKDFE